MIRIANPKPNTSPVMSAHRALQLIERGHAEYIGRHLISIDYARLEGRESLHVRQEIIRLADDRAVMDGRPVINWRGAASKSSGFHPPFGPGKAPLFPYPNV